MSSKKRNLESSESSQSDTYEVEDIVTDRIHRGRLEYRIRWVGYPPEEDTWEPEESLDCPAILKAYKNKKKRELEKRKPKRSNKSKKRKRVDSTPSPGPSRNEVSMDDVFDSAPKTPPEHDPDGESDNINVPKKSKEKLQTPLKLSEKASSTKDKAGSSSAGTPSKGHEKDKSSRSGDKSSHRTLNDNSVSSKANKDASKTSSDISSHRKKDTSGHDKSRTEKSSSSSKSVEQSASTKEKTVEASKIPNDSNKTTSKKSSDLPPSSKTSSHEKDKRDKEVMAPKNTNVPTGERSDKHVEPNVAAGISNTNISRVDVVVSHEKQKDKVTPSSTDTNNVSRNDSSAETPVIRQKAAETVIVNKPPSRLTSIPPSATQISSVPKPAATPSAQKSRNITEGTETPLSSSVQIPPQPNVVKISEILAENPPIIKDEVSELSGQFSSTIINLSLPDVPPIPSNAQSSGIAATVTRKRSSNSRSSSSSSYIAPTMDKPGSSRQSIRGEPSKNLPVVFEDPTRPQRPQSNTVIEMQPFVFDAAQERPQQIPATSAFSSTINCHKCFGNDPTVYQFAQGIQIHNVNCQKATFVLSKIWKLRCLECASKNAINDTNVEYAFCLFTADSKHFFMIKLYHRFNELYCIDATQFKNVCPMNYANFTALTSDYFCNLGDLKTEIQEQKSIVYQSMRNGPLIVYLNGGSLPNHGILQRPEVVQTVREITKLFYHELTLAIGEYMCKQVDTSALYPFVLNYYENRHPMFKCVAKFGVETNYELFFTSLIPKPQP